MKRTMGQMMYKIDAVAAAGGGGGDDYARVMLLLMVKARIKNM